MKICVKCGKKGLFLWLSKSGYCENCAAEILKERKAQQAQQEQQARLNQQQAIDSSPINSGPQSYYDVAKSDYDLHVPYNINDYWRKYTYKDVRVAGVSHANVDFSTLKIGVPVEFVPDPENEYDPLAVRIMCNSKRLGFLRRESFLQGMVIDFFKRNEPVYGAISKYDSADNIIELFMAFYKNLLNGLENCDYISAKLTKTSKKDFLDGSRQDNLAGAVPGMPLELEYNNETETYWVYDNTRFDIGEINKTISAQLLEKEKESALLAIMDDITEDDNGKYGAAIRVYVTQSRGI